MSVPEITSTSLGSGKPVVLLHAFPLSRLLWKDVVAPDGFQLIFPEFPGFGNSQLSGPGLTLSETARGLENHLQQKGITNPIFLSGISMGGYWAMEYLRQFSGRVSKVLFISTR